jgi:hypothetical protein
MMFAITIPPDYTWLQHLFHMAFALIRKVFKKDDRFFYAEIEQKGDDNAVQSD